MNDIMRRLYVALDLITDDPNYESEPPDAIDVVAAAERLKAANAVLKEINKALYDALERIASLNLPEKATKPVSGEDHYWTMKTLQEIVQMAEAALKKARRENA